MIASDSHDITPEAWRKKKCCVRIPPDSTRILARFFERNAFGQGCHSSFQSVLSRREKREMTDTDDGS